MEKFAIVYDFDYTLCTKDAPAFGLFKEYGLTYQFFLKTEEERKKTDMEGILAYLYAIKTHAENFGRPLTREILLNSGKSIDFFPGVETWFDRINEFGKENGFEVEHYLISSGISEIIEGSSIAKKFKKIFASAFHYDKFGHPDWPLNSVNYTNKTQFIFRINKGILNNLDDDKLNGYMPKEERAVKYKNMIYIGDGFTDVPSMKTMIDKGGYAIAVYSDRVDTANNLLTLGRCNASCVADYNAGSELDRVIKERILSLKQF